MTNINLSLYRISRLLAQLPEPTWKAVHIAGTNGKGSVAAYLAALLRRTFHVNTGTNASLVSGSVQEKLDVADVNIFNPQQSSKLYKVGRFTSPHFIDRWDCIRINEQPVPKDLFLQVEAQVKLKAAAVEESILSERSVENSPLNTNTGPTTATFAFPDIPNANDARVTPFELLTATAFAIFEHAKVHLAIVECGLGGRLDATNAMSDEQVVLTIITRLGLDHINLLGDTIQQIAKEKAGILRTGIPIYMDVENETETKVTVASQAQLKGAEPFLCMGWPTVRQTTDQSAPWYALYDAIQENVPQIMPHQKANWALAVRSYDYLRLKTVDAATNTEVSSDTIDPTIAKELLPVVLRDVNESYPGRLQWLRAHEIKKLNSIGLPIHEGAQILLDGAHNVQSAEVLREYLDRRANTGSGIVWILALSQGKNVGEILRVLVREDDQVVFCRFGPVDGMPWVRPNPLHELEASARSVLGEKHVVESTEHILQALTLVTNKTGSRTKTIVIAGSLYLASDLLRLLRDGTNAFTRHFSVQHPIA